MRSEKERAMLLDKIAEAIWNEAKGGETPFSDAPV